MTGISVQMTIRIVTTSSILGAMLAFSLPVDSHAQPSDRQITQTAGSSDSSTLGYADMVDLSDLSRIVAVATIRKSVPVEPERSPGLRMGAVRLYVEADIDTVIRGSASLPERVAYLVDLPLDQRGKAPKIKKQRVILFIADANPSGQLRLGAPDAQIAWTAANESRIRSIQQALVGPKIPPIVTGIDSAFHVAGTLPGEGETQIFLKTQSGDPVSLNVLSRPGQPRQWAVAFGEILDESARQPAPDTIAWHRLACGLPDQIDQQSLVGLLPQEISAIRDDYAFILSRLGRCGRTRTIG